jgi:hypothetical protein
MEIAKGGFLSYTEWRSADHPDWMNHVPERDRPDVVDGLPL